MKTIFNLLLLAVIAPLATPIVNTQTVRTQRGSAQTVKTSLGISEVTAIEALAASKKATETSIANRKLELAELEKALSAKVGKLKDELAALIKERDDLLRDFKAGFFCSKCGKAKSEFEKEGKSFEQHLDDVTGVPIPAPTTKIEQIREEYKIKIAYKRVQIQNAEKNDTAVNAKRQQIADLEKKLVTICDEMTKRSQSYEKILADQTKNKQLAWLRDLMDFASDILIAEDKIVIYEAKLIALAKEFESRSIKARDEVKDFNLKQSESAKKGIAEIERELQAFDLKHEETVASLRTRQSEISARIAEIDVQLKTVGLTEDVKQSLTAEKTSLIAQASQIETEIRTDTANHARLAEAFNEDKRRLEAEVTRLFAALPKEQEEAVARLRIDFEKLKTDARASIVAAKSEMVIARTAYRDREAFYTKENSTFFNLVAGESDRIVIAGRDTSCPVANEARQFVARNWNILLPCVSTATTRAKPYSTNIFGSYCPKDVAASSLGKYKTFLKGLGTDDTAAVKANSNVGWYDALFQKTQ